MNDQPTAHPHSGADVAEDSRTSVVSLDGGHVMGTGEIPAQFSNPGLPTHTLRAADVSERAAKRAERQVVALFLLSCVGGLGFILAYFLIDPRVMTFVPWFGRIGLQQALFGVCLALSLLGIGFGAVHWAKTLMPDHEVVEERHSIASDPADRAALVATLEEGGKQAQIKRRPILLWGGAAMGLFTIAPVIPVIGGLGKLPGSELSETFWKPGMRLMRDPEMTPIRASDVTLGSVFHVLPEGIDKPFVRKASDTTDYRNDEDLGLLERKGKAAVLLMRLNPEDFKSKEARDSGYQGIVAYSKICTHAGCPVGLYEQQTHHLLCPCHQSTFDVTQDCKVIFGPAKRPLPRLKLNVDKDGYLITESYMSAPVGPSFWEI